MHGKCESSSGSNVFGCIQCSWPTDRSFTPITAEAFLVAGRGLTDNSDRYVQGAWPARSILVGVQVSACPVLLETFSLFSRSGP